MLTAILDRMDAQGTKIYDLLFGGRKFVIEASCFISYGKLTLGHVGRFLIYPFKSYETLGAEDIIEKIKPGDIVAHYIVSCKEFRSTYGSRLIGISIVESRPLVISAYDYDIVEIEKVMGSYKLFKRYVRYYNELFGDDFDKLYIVKLNNICLFDYLLNPRDIIESYSRYERKLYLYDLSGQDAYKLLFYINKYNNKCSIFRNIILRNYRDIPLFGVEKPYSLTLNALKKGHNVILVGPPGVGKTALAKHLAVETGFEPFIVTANAHWSRTDIIGGPMIIGNKTIWQSGILIKALVRHTLFRKIGGGTYLILDEINRADVDKAFGEFFTIFSNRNGYIPWSVIDEIKEFIPEESEENYEYEYEYGASGEKDKTTNYLDPYAETFVSMIGNEFARLPEGIAFPNKFRIIATMNTTDLKNLFTLGDAFSRRFVHIRVDPPDKVEKFVEWVLQNYCTGGICKNNRDRIRDLFIKAYSESLRHWRSDQSTPLLVPPSSLVKIADILSGMNNLEHFTGISDLIGELIEATSSIQRYWDPEISKTLRSILR